MNPDFAKCIKGLEPKFQELMRMTPVTMGKPLRKTPVGGVYLFSEGDRHLYAGRSKRQLSKRLRGHVNTAKDCPFAFRLAREKTGKTKASYSGESTRKRLLQDPDFLKAYEVAKQRIRKMDIRWVAEPDPTQQALLEIYVSVVLKTPHNDFDTH